MRHVPDQALRAAGDTSGRAGAQLRSGQVRSGSTHHIHGSDNPLEQRVSLARLIERQRPKGTDSERNDYRIQERRKRDD
jgi:hypothetical protein